MTKVLSTGRTTNANEAELEVPAEMCLLWTPNWSSTKVNSLSCARLMAGSRLARSPCLRA